MDETWETDTIAPQDDDSEVPVKLAWNHNLAVITWNMQTPVGEEPQESCWPGPYVTSKFNSHLFNNSPPSPSSAEYGIFFHFSISFRLEV